MRYLKGVLYLIIGIIMFTGCGKREVFFGNEDGLMVTYCYKSMGEQFYTDVTNYEFELYQDYLISIVNSKKVNQSNKRLCVTSNKKNLAVNVAVSCCVAVM